MPRCSLCDKEKHKVQFGDPGICSQCAEKQSLPLPSEPLRPRIPCTRCSGTEFVRCLAVRERATAPGESGYQYAAPLSATFEMNTDTTFWAGRTVRSPDFGKPRGSFEAYICRGCGYTEMYARAPTEIPIGPEHATELFDVGGEAPYR